MQPIIHHTCRERFTEPINALLQPTSATITRKLCPRRRRRATLSPPPFSSFIPAFFPQFQPKLVWLYLSYCDLRPIKGTLTWLTHKAFGGCWHRWRKKKCRHAFNKMLFLKTTKPRKIFLIQNIYLVSLCLILDVGLGWINICVD